MYSPVFEKMLLIGSTYTTSCQLRVLTHQRLSDSGNNPFIVTTQQTGLYGCVCVGFFAFTHNTSYEMRYVKQFILM